MGVKPSHNIYIYIYIYMGSQPFPLHVYISLIYLYIRASGAQLCARGRHPLAWVVANKSACARTHVLLRCMLARMHALTSYFVVCLHACMPVCFCIVTSSSVCVCVPAGCRRTQSVSPQPSTHPSTHPHCYSTLPTIQQQ